MKDTVIDRATPPSPDDVLARARELRRQLTGSFREEAVKSLYAEAERVAQRAVSQDGDTRALDLDQRVDHLVTSPWLGLPIMLVLLAVVFWLTIAGANVPSAMLAQGAVLVRGPGGRPLRCRRRPVVDHRLPLARRLPRPRVGGQRDAAADGDLLPAVHDVRGPRLPAAGGLQPRFPVPPRRRARQAGADDGDGVRLQRRRRDRHPHHRFAARAAGRDPHEQLRAVQRPLPDADHARHDLRGRGVRARPSRPLPPRARWSASWCSASASRC